MLFEEVQLMEDNYSSRTQFEHCILVPRIERLYWLPIAFVSYDFDRRHNDERHKTDQLKEKYILMDRLIPLKNRIYSF